jgi:hypothetical protein
LDRWRHDREGDEHDGGEPDDDREECGDAEPSLGAPSHENQIGWGSSAMPNPHDLELDLDVTESCKSEGAV